VRGHQLLHERLALLPKASWSACAARPLRISASVASQESKPSVVGEAVVGLGQLLVLASTIHDANFERAPGRLVARCFGLVVGAAAGGIGPEVEDELVTDAASGQLLDEVRLGPREVDRHRLSRPHPGSRRSGRRRARSAARPAAAWRAPRAAVDGRATSSSLGSGTAASSSMASRSGSSKLG
jgi:hypothetical protein